MCFNQKMKERPSNDTMKLIGIALLIVLGSYFLLKSEEYSTIVIFIGTFFASPLGVGLILILAFHHTKTRLDTDIAILWKRIEKLEKQLEQKNKNS